MNGCLNLHKRASISGVLVFYQIKAKEIVFRGKHSLDLLSYLKNFDDFV